MGRKFPKNVRQIGNVSDQPKVYMEDYVNTYLNQLKEQAIDNAMGVLLTGEILKYGNQNVVYISGALQMEKIEIEGTEVLVEENVWKELADKKKEYFPETEAVGWCLIENGHPIGLSRGIAKVHERNFPKEYSVFIWRDAMEDEEIVYAYKYNELMQMGGHYIYYEKNPDMQNYMISMRKMIGVTPSEMVEDRAAKNFRSTIRGKMEYREQKDSSRFLYVMSTFLVVIVLAIGISTMNNFDRMEAVQKSIEALSMEVGQAQVKAEVQNEETMETKEAEEKTVETSEETETDSEAFVGTVPEISTNQEQLKEENYYTVEEGDTLDSISLEQYGTRGKVEEICAVNGLGDGNLIFIGQKIVLP